MCAYIDIHVDTCGFIDVNVCVYRYICRCLSALHLCICLSMDALCDLSCIIVLFK